MGKDTAHGTRVDARQSDKAMLPSGETLRMAIAARDRQIAAGAEVQQRSGDGCACGNLEGFVQWMEHRERHAVELLEAGDLVEGELRLQKIRFAKRQALNYINARRQSNTDERMDS